jgi:hypothetical protein
VTTTTGNGTKTTQQQVCWYAGENLVNWAKGNREVRGFLNDTKLFTQKNLYKTGILQVFAW